ncbi:MAG: site-specific integrase [Bacteroidota bacterium]
MGRRKLVIPKGYERKGLAIRCNKDKCDRIITSRDSRCSHKDVLAVNCPFSEHHRFQSRLWNPILKKLTGFKTYHTTDFQKVYHEHVKFKKEFRENNYLMELTPAAKKPQYKILLDISKAYSDYLEDIDVPEHKLKKLDPEYIQYRVNMINKFFDCIHREGIHPGRIAISALSDQHVGFFAKHINELGLSASTYNNHMECLKNFIDWGIAEYDIKMKNPFKKVVRKPVVVEPSVITEVELEKLLKSISSENGWEWVGNGKYRQRQQRYKDWIKPSFYFLLLSGLRRGDLQELKWSDIRHDQNYIGVPNNKVNNRLNTRAYRINVFISRDLALLLDKMGMDDKIGSDEYMFAPEVKSRKNTFAKGLSKAFTHFWKVSNGRKGVSLHNLRDTHITRVLTKFGEKTLDSRNSKEVAYKHYVDKMCIKNEMVDKDLFPIELMNNV